MVDKVDKPDAPKPYTVQSPNETKRDKPKDQQAQEDLPTFKQQEQSLYEEKFRSGPGTFRTFNVPINRITKFLYRRAVPHHGTPTVIADLYWKDGRKTEGVNFLLKGWQEFLTIKNLKFGDIIPPEFWNYHKPHIEITVRQKEHTGSSWNLRAMEKKKGAGPKTAPSKPKFSLKIFLSKNRKTLVRRSLYAFGILITLSVLLFILFGF